ncbi:cytosine deaminase [Chelativorans xinjiangense]|uniref:cytosine deaminase n=1 Tax=Chelativorans xinjiangense TaxID=2681485 RepID=UPI00135A1F08|nr:cytosine deaminase [Chelativorans xinjiangense]
MLPSFLEIPQSERFILRNAALPAVAASGYAAPARDGLLAADIEIAHGLIAAISEPGQQAQSIPAVDLRGGQVWPCFADMHTHLDKGHIWSRKNNPDGTFDGAIEAVRCDREANWSALDVAARMDFSLRSAYAHGTKLIRTHIDSLPPQHEISWPVFAEMREKWAGRIDLQAVALFPLDLMEDRAAYLDLVEQVTAHGGLLGGVTRMGPMLEEQLELLFRTAMEKGLDIDLHVDETADAEAKTLQAIAEAVIRNRFDGHVVVGHCCSLARQGENEAAETIDKVAEAGLAVVSLPMCNMYLQDRQAGRTPRWRGVTLINELAEAGVATAIASDNTRDPFYAYGDLDPVEVFREGVRVLHLDHPIDLAPRLITANPAKILRRPDVGTIAVGRPADLVLFSARGWTELLARPQSDRIVMRGGKTIERQLPDYRELDELLGVY